MPLSAQNGIVVVCPPGALATLCFKLLQIAGARSLRNVRMIDRTDTVEPDLPAALHLCNFPGMSTIQAIRAGRLDAVLIAPDLDRLVGTHVSAGSSLLESVRLISASFVANAAIGATSRSRVIFPASEYAPEFTLRPLFAACGLPTDPDSIALYVSQCTEQELYEALYSASADLTLNADDKAIVHQVLDGIEAMAQGERMHAVVWSAKLFLSGDQPDFPVASIADLSGPSRVVIYGPYLHLPPGPYQVEVIIEFSGRIEDIPFLLEFHAGTTCITRRRIGGRKSGAYRGRMILHVDDPTAPIEVRLRNEQGAIEGGVILSQISFLANSLSVPYSPTGLGNGPHL